jgi:hypothetical protein
VVVEFTDAARRPPMSASIDFPQPNRTAVPVPLPPASAVVLLRGAHLGIARSADDPLRQARQFVELVDRITPEART